MKTIRQTYLIHSSLEEVWKALTNPKYISAWDGGHSKMDDKKGTEFEFWGGDIHGKKLNRNGLGETGTILLHTDVPDDESKDINEGWKEYYLEPLKKYLENK